MPKQNSNSSLKRPSLLRRLRGSSNASQHPNIISNVHAPWHVSDESLKSIPPFYPPIDAHCTAQVKSTPSVVAERISDCLRRRNIAAEYDDETNTATCTSVDGVRFNIHLFRGGPVTLGSESNVEAPDMSRTVLVECLRIRGDVISFHWTCRAVLNAAMGKGSGKDDRQTIRTAPWEFPRLERVPSNDRLKVDQPRLKRQAVSETTLIDSSPEKKVIVGFEHAATLLKKDRVEAQQLGMESIICLTDTRSSGVPTSMTAAMAVLGSSHQNTSASYVHSFVFNLLQDCKFPNEPDSVNAVDSSSRPNNNIAGGDGSTFAFEEGAHHGRILRSLALRALANSLLVVSREDPNILNSRQFSRLTSSDLLLALVQDVVGCASRSTTAAIETEPASPHEAALATVCLRVLIEFSDNAKAQLQNEEASVWGALEKAHETERHDLLAREANRALQILGRAQLMAK